MNIYIKGGHGLVSRGASALIDEVDEDRKVKNSVVKYLQQLGHNVTDVTQDYLSADDELVDGVSRANNGGADLFVSIHFNKAYNHYDGAIGTEAWVYSTGDNLTLDDQVASRVVSALANLGFKNRGVKQSTELYELKACVCPSVIVEVCFVEATEDVALYQRIGANEIGRHIAYAISGQAVPQNTPVQEKEVEKVDYIIQYSTLVDRNIAEVMADRLNCSTIDCSRPYAFYSHYKNVIAVGVAENKSGYTNVEIKGANRQETLEKAIEYCKSQGK